MCIDWIFFNKRCTYKRFRALFCGFLLLSLPSILGIAVVMDHSDHSMHAMMNHSMMDHSNHNMDHSNHTMDHSNHTMDHSNHDGMDHSVHDPTGHGNHGVTGSGHNMLMYFHLSTSTVILFEGWTTSSWQGMLASCVAVFFMATLYEGLKVGRECLIRRSQATTRYDSVAVPTTENSTADALHFKSVRSRLLSLAHLLQTILHILQVVISYFLMLIFMTYNVYLCISVAFGAGLGYFLFAWKRAVIVDMNEHCH